MAQISVVKVSHRNPTLDSKPHLILMQHPFFNPSSPPSGDIDNGHLQGRAASTVQPLCVSAFPTPIPVLLQILPVC